ncbi:MAG: TonB-dependent receptor [Planctomycetes bacterium]|nr:TonB-dependent receptor [Planctomycetota bacterium]
MRDICRILSVAIAVASASGIARGADPDAAGAETPAEEPPARLEDVEVVAPPIVQSNEVTRYATQKTEVSAKQVQDLGARDLPSALRLVPGVNFSRYNLVGSYGGAQGGAIYIRGMGSGRPGSEIATLFDGVPKIVGVWAHPLLDEQHVGAADRIVIAKGAQPLFHGNMSMGAVDIIPKRRTDPGFETRLEGLGGSHGTWGERIDHGAKQGPFDYYISQSYFQSDGHRHKDSDGRMANVTARVGAEIAEGLDASFIFDYADSAAHDPGARGSAPPLRGTYALVDQTFVADLRNRYEIAEGSLKLYWDDLNVDWEQWDAGAGEPFDSDTDADAYGVRLREAFHAWEGGEILAGIDQDYMGGRFAEVHLAGPTSKLSDKRFRITSPYAGVSQLIGEENGWHAIPSAGIRYSDHDTYDDVWSPQAGLIVGYDVTKVHAGYGRGLNYPGMYARILFGGAGERWEHLDPEIVDHYEIGIEHAFANWLEADATFFYDGGRDRIQIVLPPPPPARLDNVGDFIARGVELTAAVRPVETVRIFAGTTFLHATPDDLPYAPDTTASAGITWRFLERFQLNVDGLYVTAQRGGNPRAAASAARPRLDPFFVANAKLSVRVTPESSPVQGTVYGAVENLTDEDYEFWPGYPMPGITFLGGGIVSF